jgi:Fe-S-cluster-containing dehydrogenase component
MSLSRRDFLKGALAGGTLMGAGASAEARPNKTMPPEALGLLFDSALCIGCKACVAACKQVNGLPPDPISEELNMWDAPLDTSAHTFNLIKVYTSGTATHKDQETDGYAFMKQSCLHCVDPSCVSACPVSAMTKDPVTGIVAYDPGACIGCRYCVAACPFHIPRFEYNKALPKIGKCELCRHRMADGHYAACAEVCPTGATLYGKVTDLKAEARRRLALTPGEATSFPRGRLGGPDWSYQGTAPKYVPQIYGEKELGGTQMIKLSSVPFEKLGHRPLPERSYASISEGLQHTLYSYLALPAVVLGALSVIAKRNVKHDDDDDGDSAGGGKK